MKIVEVSENEEGLKSLLGQKVLLFCLNYIYAGTLAGVNDYCVLLTDPHIVYDTGAFSQSVYKDAQALHVKQWYVNRSAIESFGVGK
jgi:hypothetical protein